tara:strand:+ start:2754 stop:4337 length:1584 start_codon:yes stop_codon:yes gene_type:complete
MAEIRQSRLSGYINPGLEEQDIAGNALKRKQMALTEALGKYQIANAKEQQRQLGINKKANDWFAVNSDALYSNSSNPLDPDSMIFSDPDKVSELYKQYRNEVGGSYNTFSEYIKMGKANEERNNRRQLNIILGEYDNEKDGMEAVNNILINMDEGDRNRLFSMLDDETYSRLNQMYDTEPKGTLEKLTDFITDNPEVGIPPAFYAAYRFFKRGRVAGGGKVVDEILDKAKKATRKRGKRRSKAKTGPITRALPLQKGLPPRTPNDPNTIYARGETVKQLPGQVSKTGRSAQDIAEEAAQGGRNRANATFSSKNIQDAEFEEIIKKQNATIPTNKLDGLMKQADEMVKSGRMTSVQAKSFKDVIEEMVENGVKITKVNVAEALKTRPGGMRLLEKIANKEMSWKGFLGYGLAGAVIGGNVASKGAEMLGFGEKGQQVADISGRTIGAGLPMIMNSLKSMVQEMGAKGVYEKLLRKKGTKWMAKKVATGALKTLTAGSTTLAGGVGIALGGAMLTADAIEIYNILNEPD